MTDRPELVSSTESLAAHTLALARDLLNDIELSRLPPEQLLLKASRLARLVENDEVRQWLEFELRGYVDNELGRKYMSLVGRWTEEEKGLGYWQPLAGLAGSVAAMEVQIQQLRVPNVSFAPSSANPNEFVTGFAGANVDKLAAPGQAVLARLAVLTNAVAQLREIQSRVMAEIHDFAVKTYYRLAFSGEAESIFRSHQAEIDRLLRDLVPEVLEKIPSICARLSEGDNEAVSQALNLQANDKGLCRRRTASRG